VVNSSALSNKYHFSGHELLNSFTKANQKNGGPILIHANTSVTAMSQAKSGQGRSNASFMQLSDDEDDDEFEGIHIYT
jgi:hypothetical protein